MAIKDQVENIDFEKALSERYLSYALSTIMSRSLPDVRDGLKPVHRRILYAMLQLKLEPSSGYKKCARIVGDVIGKYHPHGEIAIYDALVRLAQSFSLRYPLIDGQGNFGSIDGDNAAAMRYTESKMTEIGILLMRDIDKDTVDFRPTYDDSEIEPDLLPASFPNLLANGSEGIAVGMATSIPPHNLAELCGGILYLIDHPEASIADILGFVKGPDFPTGGIIIDNQAAISQVYISGRGSFRVRSRWHTQIVTDRLYQIVITEIPYQVQKAKLIEHLAGLFKDKKIPLVSNIRDESTDQIRLIIEPSDPSVQATMIMEVLFKLSALESRVAVNMNVITNNLPQVMNILEILTAFLSYRQNIVTRRSQYLINKIANRLEILNGLKITYLNLDAIIKIIRQADQPKPILMTQFSLTDIQAESILNTKLRALRKLEEQALIKEYNLLINQHRSLSQILDSPKHLARIIKTEIKEIQTKFSLSTELGRRRTDFIELNHQDQIIDISALVAKEPVTILCSQIGWIRTIKAHNHNLSSIKYKEGDRPKFVIEAYTTDKIIICSQAGRFFTILVNNLSQSRKDGESIKLIIDLGNHEITAMFIYQPGQQMLLASNAAEGFMVNSDHLIARTKLGKQIMRLPEQCLCIACLPVNADLVACLSENRQLLIFNVAEIPEKSSGRGVRLQLLRQAKLSHIQIFSSKQGLSWPARDNLKTEKNLAKWQAKRGAAGVAAPLSFKP